MTHVHIKRNRDGSATVLVDGVDVSMKVLARGFAVEFHEGFTEPPTVHMQVAADTLEVDLPEAMVALLQESE